MIAAVLAASLFGQQPPPPVLCSPNPTSWFGIPVAGTAFPQICQQARTNPQIVQKPIPSGGDMFFLHYQGVEEHYPAYTNNCVDYDPPANPAGPYERNPETVVTPQALGSGGGGAATRTFFTPGEENHPWWGRTVTLSKVIYPAIQDFFVQDFLTGSCEGRRGLCSYLRWKVRGRLIRRHIRVTVNGTPTWARCDGCGPDVGVARLFSEPGFDWVEPLPRAFAWEPEEPVGSLWCQ